MSRQLNICVTINRYFVNNSELFDTNVNAPPQASEALTVGRRSNADGEEAVIRSIVLVTQTQTNPTIDTMFASKQTTIGLP